MEVILRPCHCDVEQAAFFLQFGGGAGAQIGGHAAVDNVEAEDRLPLLALREMDGRQDEVVLVEQRHASLVAGGIRRIEGELGQETFARAPWCWPFSMRRSGRFRARAT